MTDRALDLADIQGNVLGGFNTDVQVFVALASPTEQALPSAAAWVAGLADAVTSVAEVRAQRDAMKSVTAAAPQTWLCVAVSRRLLLATQPDLYIRDVAFNGGMMARASSVLGDKTDQASWDIGNDDKTVDVLLIVASNDETSAVKKADDLSASALAVGMVRTFRDRSKRLAGETEHFGFRDGISQPLVLGDDAGGILGAGNFVFGYPSIPGGTVIVPYHDERGVADNGSLLVFRRLEQNVPAFDAFCTAEATRLAAQWPRLTPSHLKALLVGRWPSGVVASVDASQDPGTASPSNEFDFSDDPDGKRCPAGAHIRKVNPRLGRKDVLKVPRILRRGIPYGVPFAQDPTGARGLHFVAFQTSIAEQFEFLTQHWMNSDINPAPGQDLLVGRNDVSRALKIAGPQGVVEVSAGSRQWITPRGGAYLFAPGRSGLRKLGTPSAPLGLWKLKVLSARALDGALNLFATRQH